MLLHTELSRVLLGDRLRADLSKDHQERRFWLRRERSLMRKVTMCVVGTSVRCREAPSCWRGRGRRWYLRPEKTAVFCLIFCSAMMYFVTCITVVCLYSDRFVIGLSPPRPIKWTEQSVCTILNISVTEEMNCSYSCSVDCLRSSRFLCVQVYVSLNYTNRVELLHHNEEMENTGSKCFYIPKCQEDHAAIPAVIMNVSENLREQRHVPRYYDPSDHQANFLLSRLYGSSAIFLSFFWLSCMLAGGATIILLVKLTQYLAILCGHNSERSK